MRIILTLFLVIIASAAAADPYKKKDLYGAWSYVSAYTELADGTRIDQFGPKPTGMFIILPGGVYSHIVMEHDLPRVASGLIKQMTTAEAERIAEGTLAHYGNFTTDERRGTFTVTIFKSSFPNFNGVAQTRTILELTKTTLRYVNPVSSAGPGAKVYATLRRISLRPPR